MRLFKKIYILWRWQPCLYLPREHECVFSQRVCQCGGGHHHQGVAGGGGELQSFAEETALGLEAAGFLFWTKQRNIFTAIDVKS